MRPIPELFDPQTLVLGLLSALAVTGAVIAIALAVGSIADRLLTRRPATSAQPPTVERV